MNISYRGIPKFQNGNKLWYTGIHDYNPSNYIWEWDTKAGLKKGDTKSGFQNPWASPTAGLDPGRYTPTDLSPEYGKMGINQNHFTYTKGVEGQQYYKDFTEALFDKDNKLTSVGMEYIKQSDALLPEGHNARILDANGNIKDSITVKLNDAHGRAPQIKIFNLKNPEELKAYINHVRNDQTVGGRHNVFPKVGKRYFYYDDQGTTHWVSPEEAQNYEMFETPDEGFDNKSGVYWYDYQLKGPKKDGNKIAVGNPDEKNKSFDWNKIRNTASRLLPGLLAGTRLAGTLINNNKIYDEALKGIKPTLMNPYHTHRQVVGDEATKQSYYRMAAQGQTSAARPITSDASLQSARQFEAKRIGDELRAKGDLADNAEIRRTSDESNQHQWANVQRDTEVANTNRASIDKAEDLRHKLLAQKHAAQGTAVDNWLKEIEYKQRQKQAKAEALQDQIWQLDYTNNLQNDPEYLNLKNTAEKAWDDALKAGKTPANEKTVKDALQKLRNWQYQYQRQALMNRPVYAKAGTKIKTTYKQKDDLLYKSTRDAVEHFRKMSKMSSDAHNRKQPKIQKLAPHPKGSTRKYQQGGLAPFLTYTPVALGGETTTSSQVDTSSTTSSKKDKNETLDVIKDLFKNIEGLPSDVNGVYESMSNFLAKSKAFGENLDSDDLASLYLSQMQRLNHIKFSKDQFDKVNEIIKAKDAGSEIAIDQSGRIAVQDINTGKISYKSWDEVKKSKSLTPLTNNNLMQLRAYSPESAFADNIFAVTSNATSMSEIAKFLKAQLPSLGSSEQTIEGYTKQDSNTIKEGLKLLAEAPAGDYKFTQYTKSQQNQATAAINYLLSTLPKNMKVLLQVNAETQGISIKNIIQSLVGSTMSESSKLEFDAVTGKAAKDANGNSKEGNLGDMDPAAAFFMGIGDRNTFVIQDKTKDGLKIDTISMPLLDAEGHGMSNATLQQLKEGRFAGQLNINHATMGGVRISPNGVNNVLISGGNIYQTELPIDKQALASKGIIQPDLSFLSKIEKADEQLRQRGITDRSNLTSAEIDIINKIYKENGLPIIYKKDGTGKSVLSSEYRRFAMVDGMATDDAFEGDMTFNNGALEVEDDKELDQFETMMKAVTKNDKYKLDRGWLGFGGNQVHKGIIYIPMATNQVTALAGTGYKGTANEYNAMERKQQQADFARQKQFNPAGSAANLNI